MRRDLTTRRHRRRTKAIVISRSSLGPSAERGDWIDSPQEFKRKDHRDIIACRDGRDLDRTFTLGISP